MGTDLPACEHHTVRTYRAVPPFSKCLDCNKEVTQVWVVVEDD